MREIKFRAWTGERMLTPEFDASYANRLMIDLNGKQCIHHMPLGDNEYPSYVLMQYTGLKDKNGVEIYEGDIVKAPALYAVNLTIVYNQVFCCFEAQRDGDEIMMDCVHTMEVIGNIHQNPDLL